MFRRSTSTAPAARPAALHAGHGAEGHTVDAADEGHTVDATLDPAVGLVASTGRAVSGARHARRVRRQKAVDDAALRARLERVHRRLAEVGAVQVTGRADAIDNDAARRDPLTRPFASPFPAAVGEHPPSRRPATAPLPRPA